MARFLIKKGANLNARAKDKHGGTAPHWAAVLGRVEMARRLIEAGAEVNAKDNNAFTPLDATHYGRPKPEIARLLRAKGGKSKNQHRKEPAL